MTVPTSKRKTAPCEFVNQARIVMRETQKLMRKWPKSRQITEVQFVLKTAYYVFEKAVWANTIYCVVPSEFAARLSLLQEAYGKINCLASFCDDWLDDIPTVRNKRENVEHGGDFYVPVVSEKRLVNYVGTLSHAISIFAGAIKSTRTKLKDSLEKYPNYQLTLPIVDAELLSTGTSS